MKNFISKILYEILSEAGVGNRRGRGYTPLTEKILNIPPENFKKIYPPLSVARSAAAIFLAEIRKLTFI